LAEQRCERAGRADVLSGTRDQAPRRLVSPMFVLTTMAVVCGVAVVLAAAAVQVKKSNASFTNLRPANADIAAARIFAAERITPAFSVNDRSSGSAVDASSSNAFANDSRYFLTRAWSTSFASDRYIDLDLGSPLPLGLTAQTVSANIRLSSHTGSGSVCMYLEARRASTNAVLSTHGSSGSPLACTSGSTVSVVNVSLGAVSTTDIADDLRLRLYMRDSVGGLARIDEGTVTGQTPYSSWTLYPVLTRESYSGQLELLRWGLAGP
jgi:hypothetical protein